MAGLMVSNLLRRARASEGQGMVEYALIIALVAIVLVTALSALTGGIGSVFTSITKSL